MVARRRKENVTKIMATFVSACNQGQLTHSARTKIPKIVATFVSACSQGQCTHSARTKIPKIGVTFVYASSARTPLGPKYLK